MEVIELDYTKIQVVPIRPGSQELRNATKTFGSRYSNNPGKNEKTNTMKNLFGVSNNFTTDSLIKFKNKESNNEPSRLLANRDVYFKNKFVPLIEVVITNMIEEIEKAKKIDSKGIKFFKGKTVVYIDYREDYENIVEDMSKKLISIFSGDGGINDKAVVLGGVISKFNYLKKKQIYKSSSLKVRLREFTMKGGVIPTEIQETGTTIILNAVLRKNVKFPNADSILKYGTTHKTREGLDRVFGAYKDRLGKWTHTYYEQQRSILDVNKFADSSWAEFTYGDESFTKFFSDRVKDAERSDGSKITKYTEWNPSDIWAAHRLKSMQDDIEKEMKGGANVISKLNNLLRGYFDRNELIGLSLKKIGDKGEAHVAFYNNNVNDLQLKIIEEYGFNDLIFDLNNIVEPEVGTVYIHYGSDRKFSISASRTSSGTLALTAKIKGASAQAGQAIIAMVVDLLKKKLNGKKTMFDKDIKKSKLYPPTWNDWEDNKVSSDTFKDYKMMYNSLKSHFKKPPEFSEFIDQILYSTYKKDSRNAIIKLAQIRFFYDVFNMKNDTDIKEFWQDLLYLAMKVDRNNRFEFAPFAKISDV